MNLTSDLIDIIASYFLSEGIDYEDRQRPSDLATLYCEMWRRRISSTSRQVHFSSEIHNSLGKLTIEPDTLKKEAASEAWGTVFYLSHLFREGGSITPYLSKGIQNAGTRDALLFDYGIHHLHLNRSLENSGFVKRSDYLLLVIVSDIDAYFVDVRPHSDPDNLLWVRQDLLYIIQSNWPELTTAKRLHGVTGTTLTDKERKVLRSKNTNHVIELEGRAIAPLGGGLMADGSSASCRWWAMRLLHEVKYHEQELTTQLVKLKEKLNSDHLDVRLVLLDSLNSPTELTASLQEDNCLSKDLYRMGFVVIEATTGTLIRITPEDEG